MGGYRRGGVHVSQFSIDGGEVIEGDVRVDQFSIEEGANRRGSMLVNCFAKRQWNYWSGDTGCRYLIIDNAKTNLKFLGIEALSKEDSLQFGRFVLTDRIVLFFTNCIAFLFNILCF